jgi:hypothetical protein
MKMGRNSIPKLGEWREGHLYRFRTSDGDPVFSAEGGKFIVYEVIKSEGVHVLATAFADGLQEVMASMWESGFDKGKQDGKRQALADVRRALGVKEDV